jgi:DNA mismatch repair protein MutS
VQRARVILRQLEGAHTGGHFRPEYADQLSLFGTAESPVVERLKRLDVDAITPIQALNVLSELKQIMEDAR